MATEPTTGYMPVQDTRASIDCVAVGATESGGRHHIDIRHPISGIKKEAVSADVRGPEGREGPAIAIEKKIQGRIFYQDVYTSVQLCAEFADAEHAENIGLQMHRRLLERFIGTIAISIPTSAGP